MKLLKRLVGLVCLVFVITLFMQNKDVRVSVDYFGFAAPLDVPFWILATVCFCVGFALAAVGDFLAYLKWRSEKRRLKKKEGELSDELEKLKSTVQALQDLNKRLKADMEEKTNELRALKQQKDLAGHDQQHASQSEASSLTGPTATPSTTDNSS
jgi:uncharacterized membrane protein YciS (DUF1049 family)